MMEVLIGLEHDILINHEKTEAEEKMLVLILLTLRGCGYSGELLSRSIIANSSGQIRRPDFYLPRYGFAIEVDGATRETMRIRQEDFARREKFYNELGVRLLILHSTDSVSGFKLTRFQNEFKSFLFKNRLPPKELSKLNKRIHDGRKKYEALHSGSFKLNGTVALQFNKEMMIHGFKETRHFGGTKIILRSKYNISPRKEINLSTSKSQISHSICNCAECDKIIQNLKAVVTIKETGIINRSVVAIGIFCEACYDLGQKNGALNNWKLYTMLSDLKKRPWHYSKDLKLDLREKTVKWIRSQLV